MRLRKCLLSSIILGIMITAPAKPSFADFWSKAKGVITDPFKIEKGSENAIRAVELAMVHAKNLIDLGDKNVDGYIEELDRIIGQTRDSISADITNIGSITDNTLTRVATLEKEFFKDSKALVECTLDATGYKVQETSAEVLNDLGKRRPRLVILGFTISEVKFTKTDFKSPIEAYRTALNVLETELDQITEQDPQTKITDIYGDIGRLSKLLRCHYDIGSVIVAEMYLREMKQIRNSKSWIKVIIR